MGKISNKVRVAAIVSAAGVGPAALIAINNFFDKGGNRLIGFDDDKCTRDDLWTLLGIRPPCDPEQTSPRWEHDVSRVTENNVYDPEGTPDWYLQPEVLFGAAIVVAVGSILWLALRQKGERVVGA